MLDGENLLVSNAAQGEASAFGLLYDHYQPKIYRFVLMKVGRSEEAEDLTHQVFLSAWQNIKKYESRGFPFSSWLYRIARNAVIDHYRTLRSEASIDEMSPDFFVAPALAEFDLNRKMEFDKVRLAIQKLEPAYQDVVIMRFVEDLSIKETAAALNKTEGSVKVIQHRAIKKLKELIG